MSTIQTCTQLICPYCKKETKIPSYAVGNVEQYGKTATVSSSCCQKPLKLSRVILLQVRGTLSSSMEDDWNNPMNPTTSMDNNEPQFFVS